METPEINMSRYGAIISLIDDNRCLYAPCVGLYNEDIKSYQYGITPNVIGKVLNEQYISIEKVRALFPTDEYKTCGVDELISVINRDKFVFIYQFCNYDGIWRWRIYWGGEWGYLADVLGNEIYEMPRAVIDGVPELPIIGEVIRLGGSESGAIVNIVYSDDHKNSIYVVIRLSDYQVVGLPTIQTSAYNRNFKKLLSQPLFNEVCERAFAADMTKKKLKKPNNQAL